MKITIETAPGESAPSVAQAEPEAKPEPSAAFAAAVELVRATGGLVEAVAFLQRNSGAIDVEANPSNTEPADRNPGLGMSQGRGGFCLVVR